MEVWDARKLHRPGHPTVWGWERGMLAGLGADCLGSQKEMHASSQLCRHYFKTSQKRKDNEIKQEKNPTNTTRK